MATLKQATAPRDTSKMTLLTNPANMNQRPAAPSSADPEFSALALAPIPPIMGTETDAARQFYRQSVSQLRMPPLPSASTPASGASASSQAISVVNGGSIAFTGTSVTGIDLQTNNVDNTVQNILNITGPGVSYGPGKGQVQIASQSVYNYQQVEGEGVGVPTEPVLNFLAPIIVSDVPGISTDVEVPVMVGDSGSGGVKGLAPAPAAGDFASGAFLNAGGGYSIPPGTGGAAHYQLVQSNAVSVAVEPRLNFLSGFTVTDNPGNTSSDVALVAVPVITQYNTASLTTNQAITANTTTAITQAQITVTFPSTGGPWRVDIRYWMYWSTGATPTVDIVCVDSLGNAFAPSQHRNNTSGSLDNGNVGSDVSPVTYANGATVGFQLYVEAANNISILAAATFSSLLPNSTMRAIVISSN